MNRLLKPNILFTLLPALLWWGAIYARPQMIQPRCSTDPQTCSKQSVLFMDRLSLNMEDSKADQYSYFTQNLSGIFAIAAPVAWNTALFALGKMNGIIALTTLGKDLVIILQTVVWNGFFTEASHLISQRPRPFVYSDPVQKGIDPAHYTSFYSGHTSFAAATTMAVFLILLSQGAPFIILLLSAIIMETLVFSTAYFRILAGRHFLTDVICAAISGSLIAWSVAALHRKAKKWP